MNILKIICISFFITFAANVITFAQDLPIFNIITEDWKPYQYEKDGKLQGIAVDVLGVILKEIQSTQGVPDIKLFPWAMGYDQLQNQENTILFSTTRTPEREKLFKWVGPIFSYSTVLVGQKNKKIIIKSKKDLHKYRIGTIINDSSELYMNKLGVSTDKLHRNVDSISNIKKIDADRIDLVVTNWVEFKLIAKDLNIDPGLYEKVFTIDTSVVSYTFHKNTPDWIIDKFQKSLDVIKKEGIYDQIMERYKHFIE